MDIYKRIFSDHKTRDALWIVCQSDEEVQTFSNWILEHQSDVYTEFIRGSIGDRADAFALIRDPYFGTEYIIDRLRNVLPLPSALDCMMFQDWYELAFVDAQTPDISDIESLL